MGRRETAGAKLRRSMDRALEHASSELGQPLVWSEAEELMLAKASAAADRSEQLQTEFADELAGERRSTALARLSSEIRLLDKQAIDLVKGINVGLGPPKSAQHQAAVRARWDRRSG